MTLKLSILQVYSLSAYFSSFRILNCHAFDSAEMKIGQMKKVPLGLWEKLSKLQGILCESGIYFFLHHFELFQLQKEQQISQTYQAFLRKGSETRQEILHANISKTKFSFVISFSLLVSEFAWDKRLSGNSAALSLNNKWTSVCLF